MFFVADFIKFVYNIFYIQILIFPEGFMSFSFGFMPVLFFIPFILVFVVIAAVIIKGVMQNGRNNKLPRLSVGVNVVAKRTSVHTHHNNNGFDTTSNTYYMTFQFDSGDRMEFIVPSDVYGLCAEGDFGNLTFQGTRFISFERV